MNYKVIFKEVNDLEGKYIYTDAYTTDHVCYSGAQYENKYFISKILKFCVPLPMVFEYLGALTKIEPSLHVVFHKGNYYTRVLNGSKGKMLFIMSLIRIIYEFHGSDKKHSNNQNGEFIIPKFLELLKLNPTANPILTMAIATALGRDGIRNVNHTAFPEYINYIPTVQEYRKFDNSRAFNLTYKETSKLPKNHFELRLLDTEDDIIKSVKKFHVDYKFEKDTLRRKTPAVSKKG